MPLPGLEANCQREAYAHSVGLPQNRGTCADSLLGVTGFISQAVIGTVGNLWPTWAISVLGTILMATPSSQWTPFPGKVLQHFFGSYPSALLC